MKKLPRLLSFASIVIVATIAFAPASRAAEWLPVTAEDRAATESKIDPDAGAEILYRMEQFDNSEIGTGKQEEYVRIKVFNEKGVKRVAKTQVECDDYQSIDMLRARVIKPDGTIINVDKKTFYDREVIRFGDMRVHVRSFSFPSLEPGDIAEYQYEKIGGRNLFGAKLCFQKDLPTRYVIFRIKPVPSLRNFRTVGFSYRCANQDAVLSRDGYNCIEMRDVPALAPEPHMPPIDDVQSWMIFYMTDGTKPDNYWKEYGRRVASDVERHARKPSKLVRETAAEVTVGAATPEEKLERLNTYCRSLRNILRYAPLSAKTALSDAMRDNHSPDEIITSKAGNYRDTPVLFIAMARALGFDARIALCASWRDGTFKRGLCSASLLGDRAVAVKLGETWRYYDPVGNRVATGTLRWANEGVAAMICTPKEIEWVTTPRTPAAASLEKRTARLRLDTEGTLTGHVTIEYRGHSETAARYNFYKKTPQKIYLHVGKQVRDRLPSAVVTRVSVPDADDLSKPLVLTYQVKIPGYAESAGSRLFVQPGFFVKGAHPRFSAETRKHDIFFPYAMATEDDVTIVVPEGYELEEASAPPSPGAANWGSYKTTLAFKRSTREIMYKRNFEFSPTQLPASQYKLIKGIFDYVHAHDAHMLTLRAKTE